MQTLLAFRRRRLRPDANLMSYNVLVYDNNLYGPSSTRVERTSELAIILPQSANCGSDSHILVLAGIARSRRKSNYRRGCWLLI
jgi:hypothetical protein